MLSRMLANLIVCLAAWTGSGALLQAVVQPRIGPYLNVVEAPHEVRVLEDDTAALENVLEMIDGARKSIAMEYYLFAPDRSGELILQALVRQARRGVRIRILVDYYPNALKDGLDRFYAAELSRSGIAVRYFNPVDLLEIGRLGFRDHRKLLVIDGDEMVSGGRNLADSYFGLDRKVDYLDRDLWVRGPIVACALSGFNRFWSSSIVTSDQALAPTLSRTGQSSNPHAEISAKAPATVLVQQDLRAAETRMAKVRQTLTPCESDFALRARVARFGKEALAHSPVVPVHSISLVSDTPWPGRAVRKVTPYLEERLRATQRSVWMENFIFIPRGEEKQILLELLNRGVKADLLTNGFESNPNGLMAEIAHSRQTMAARHGLRICCYTSQSTPARLFSGSGAIWGLHTKSMVFDGKDTVIGSYNLDPRSAWINDEGLVIVNDCPQLAKIVQDDIRIRMRSATLLNPDGSYADGTHCFSISRDLTVLLRPLVEIFVGQL